MVGGLLIKIRFLRGGESGKEKARKHKHIFPVTARVGGDLPTGWGGGVSRPVARGQKFMCCVRNPRNINVFVRVPGREESGSRPGGSVTGVTEKLFMCQQMFMCLFRPLGRGESAVFWGHPQTCVYPDVCLGIAHVSGKAPLSGQGEKGRYTMYLPFSPQGICRAKKADTLCIR